MDPTIRVVKPFKLLDGTHADKFRKEVSQCVEENADVVLIDFQDVTFMDSSGLGALVLALKTVRAAGGKMFVCAINDQVRMLFELTSMNRVFVIYESREMFEESFKTNTVES